MKKTPLLIALSIFSLLAAIVFLYDFKLEKKKSPWDFIGQNVVLVYAPPTSSNRFVQQAFQDVTKDYTDSPTKSKLTQFFTGKNIIASLSVTARDNFDFTFYIPMSSDQDKKQLIELQQLLTSKKNGQRQRNFEGAVIYEIGFSTGRVFSFAVVDEVFVASSTSFLVEDAIRISIAENPITFKKSNSKLFQLSTSEKDDGDLYVNLPEFFRWVKSFSDNDILSLDFAFGKSLITDLKTDDENAFFNGFATDSLGSDDSFLKLFSNQSPVEFGMKSVISINSAAVLHYGIPQPESWYRNRDAFLKTQLPSMKDSLQKLTAYKFIPSEFYKSLDNEVGLSLINDRSTINSIFIAELKNVSSGMSSLEKLAENLSTQHKDSVYSEKYSNYTIGKIDATNFAYALFWPLATKSSQTYFALVGNYVMFSESDVLLKQALDDVDDENTWSKSLLWSTFLQTALQGSNIDLFFDTSLISSYLMDHLTTRWKPYFASTNFLAIERGAIQFSKLEQDFYFSANFPHKKYSSVANTSVSGGNIKLPDELISQPFLVKNHDTGKSELIVQDTLNDIYLVGLNGKVEWKLDIDSKITNEIAQIDFYKNGKLQYIFTTKNKIHIIDRLGHYISGFPKSMPSKSLQFSSVVDYDKSKNYRFLVSDNERNIFIVDKGGAILEGWNPKLTKRNLFASARHQRIMGKDYFIAIQDDGLVYVLNRRGEMIKGFPLALNMRPEGDFFFEGGKNFSSSTFTLISRDGGKIEFNMLGKIVSQEALMKTSAKSHFYLLVSDDHKLSSFVRIDQSKIAAFDQRGKLLFEKENPGSENLLPHLEKFDSDKYMFSFTDTVQELAYIWDNHGNSVVSRPIETRARPALTYNQRSAELNVYWTNGNAISSASLHWPN